MTLWGRRRRARHRMRRPLIKLRRVAAADRGDAVEAGQRSGVPPEHWRRALGVAPPFAMAAKFRVRAGRCRME